MLSSWLAEQEFSGSISDFAAIRFQRLVMSCFLITANYNDGKSSFLPNANLHVGFFHITEISSHVTQKGNITKIHIFGLPLSVFK